MSGDPKTPRPRGRAGWLFLILVLVLYGLCALWQPDQVGQAAATAMRMLVNLLPVLLLVFGLLLLSHWWLDERRIRRYFGREAGRRGWLMAVLAGVLSMGPIYPWFALVADWRQRGMSPALAGVFLYSRGLKLALLPMLAHYFGLAYTIVLSAYMLLFALLVGWAMHLLLGEGDNTRLGR
jgi:uncharacterized membrane protein YraQ (UPF0718 family)